MYSPYLTLPYLTFTLHTWTDGKPRPPGVPVCKLTHTLPYLTLTYLTLAIRILSYLSLAYFSLPYLSLP